MSTNIIRPTDEQLESLIRDLADVIADQAEAIAHGTVIGPKKAAVARIEGNVATLKAWIDLQAVRETNARLGITASSETP